MALDVDAEIRRLETMPVGQLLAVYRRVYREPARSRHKQHLVRQIAWGMQCQEESRLSEKSLRRVGELMQQMDLRVASATGRPGRRRNASQPPIPGTVLVRPYKGRMLQVRVLEDGFEFEGQTFQTLSALAKHITGSHWNGNLFFGIPSHAKPRSTG